MSGDRPRAPLSRAARGKLAKLLAGASARVPLYRRLYAPLGLSPGDFRDPDILAPLPVLTKADLLAAPPAERIDARWRPADLAEEATTGSTGQPFSVWIDRRYRARRNRRFLRALLAVGYRPWQRLMLLTDRYPGTVRRGRLHYVSVEQPTGAILEAYRRIRPHVLYGFATPLRLLAERLGAEAAGGPRPRLVISTAEMLDTATREALERGFEAGVADFYGMTEMGLVAWRPAGISAYIMSPEAVVTEFVPDDSCPGRYRLLMTNLDLESSPIIRYDAGDLAVLDADGRVTAFEGRRLDTIVCRDGSELSPYRITDALRDIAGLRRFRVRQCDTARIEVEAEAEPAVRGAVSAEIRGVFERLLGAGLGLEVTFRECLVPEGAAKFRPVVSEVPR